jgi:chromosome partitioning protein
MTPDTVSVEMPVPHILGASSLPVLAVVNQKGGVGKTTTAINLGAALAELGHPVLLVDLDPQANSTSGLGLNPSRARRTVYHLLTGECTVAEAAVETGVPGLRLVPSQIDLAGAEIELASMTERETRLRQALATTPDGVELVIIDCPPSLGLLTLNALAAATKMLIPTQCEYFALEGLRHLFYTHQLIRSSLNPQLEIGGILMTQFDARTTLAWDVLAEVRRSHPTDLLKTLIPRNVRISEAPSHGKSVIQYDPTCRGAAAYRELAQELMARSTPT